MFSEGRAPAVELGIDWQGLEALAVLVVGEPAGEGGEAEENVAAGQGAALGGLAALVPAPDLQGGAEGARAEDHLERLDHLRQGVAGRRGRGAGGGRRRLAEAEGGKAETSAAECSKCVPGGGSGPRRRPRRTR